MPPGSRPIGVSQPTIASATARTVPSPPSGQTRSTPLERASSACPVPGSRSVVRMNSGSAQPWLIDCSVIRLAHRRHVVELGGVDDDRRATNGGVGHGALRAEVVAVRAAPPPATTVGSAGTANAHPCPPCDAEGEQDDENDRREGDPAGVFAKHGPTLPHGRGRIGTGQSAARAGRAIGRFRRVGRIRTTFGRWRRCCSPLAAVARLPWSPWTTTCRQATRSSPTPRTGPGRCSAPVPTAGSRPDLWQPADIAPLTLASTAPWTAVLQRESARQRPAPTVWSPLEYACHVRDVCRVFTGGSS